MSKLQAVRINAGLSLVQVAKEAHVSRQTIDRMECGELPVRAVKAALVAKALSRLIGETHTYRSLGIWVTDVDEEETFAA
jgi:transcriptional regulator with XRE-family HTH domain